MTTSTFQFSAANYKNLKRLAQSKLNREYWENTFQATDLTNESVLRLEKSGRKWRDGGRFMAAAAQAMSCVLKDRIRIKNALKRGGRNLSRSIDERDIHTVDHNIHLLEIEDVLNRYSQICPEKAAILRMRIEGHSTAEISKQLGISVKTVDRWLLSARTRLYMWLVERRETGSQSK